MDTLLLRKILLLSFILLKFGSTSGQIVSGNPPEPAKEKDSVTIRRNRKALLDIQIDQRKSFLGQPDFPITINGLNVGWTYNKRIRFGVGAYFVNAVTPNAYFVPFNQLIKDSAPGATILYKDKKALYLVEATTKLYYITPSIQYNFYRSKWLDIGIIFEIGTGYSEKIQTDYFSGEVIPVINKKDKILKTENWFFPASGGVSFLVKLSEDVGISAAAGYRQIVEEVGVSDNFNGSYYQLGLRLFPFRIKSEIAKDLKTLGRKKEHPELNKEKNTQ
ncbi:hypothetical protein SAMN04515674_11962 [Pseudarcicella hirudinis]|uniref:Outer membrane protein beta-barrel domain-containing protein n=1 Tax=Pseudarcicella hirudinis TaxID=1079859 RepID=A0A1I5YKZ0_9BACT|nr:hypothetical protein [Pseudarcicella hirudinis]SFQ44567.1 hypothetical protein SAMN04515674_11962 [Pseudarcicella hirudinis]